MRVKVKEESKYQITRSKRFARVKAQQSAHRRNEIEKKQEEKQRYGNKNKPDSQRTKG